MLFLIACLAALGLLAALLGRVPAGLNGGQRAAARLERGGAALPLWGLAAALFGLALAAVLVNIHPIALLGVLVNIHPIALLGVLVFAAVLCLGALGLGVAAQSLGGRLDGGPGEPDTFAALRRGLWVLLLSAAVPFAGWLLVLLALAAGVGAVLDTLVTRTDAPSELE